MTGIVLTARLGSNRLKRKHLLKIRERPILSYLIERIQTEFFQELHDGKMVILIATSCEEENKEFEKVFGPSVEVFYGSIDNIPLRHMQAAKKHELNNIIAVDGDDILCSTQGMRQIYVAMKNGASYVKTAGLPFGMNVVGYDVNFLRDALNGSKEKVLETGWGRIFDETKLVTLHNDLKYCRSNLRFTLDYPQDFSFFEELILTFSGDLAVCSDQDIVNHVITKRLYEVTDPIVKEYWANFNCGVAKEKSNETR